MSLKYDNFRFYWAAVTEKSFKWCPCKGIVPLCWDSEHKNRLFFRPQLSLKIKLITMNS